MFFLFKFISCTEIKCTKHTMYIYKIQMANAHLSVGTWQTNYINRIMYTNFKASECKPKQTILLIDIQTFLSFYQLINFDILSNPIVIVSLILAYTEVNCDIRPRLGYLDKSGNFISFNTYLNMKTCSTPSLLFTPGSIHCVIFRKLVLRGYSTCQTFGSVLELYGPFSGLVDLCPY